MFATDLLQVLYAPQKAFRRIIENPKYWAPILIFVLFIAAQTAFYFSYYQKSYTEQTYPASGDFGTWTQNATRWTTNEGASASFNYFDFINSSFYGNSSLQFDATGNILSMALSDFNVSCGPGIYQNFSLRVKVVEPQASPQNVTLTMYSMDSTDFFQYDLTSAFGTSTVGQWQNLTVPVGSGNWQIVGSPTWNNITGLSLTFEFPESSSITVRLQGVFFRGLYKTPIEVDTGIFVASILQVVFMRFIFQWLLFTGLMYLFIKGMKGNVMWKPLFIAVGCALIVLVVQALINLVSTAALGTMYYPLEALANVPGEATAASAQAVAASETFNLITSGVQLFILVWLGALGAFVVRTLLPEFTWSKAAVASAVSLVLTVLLLALLGV